MQTQTVSQLIAGFEADAALERNGFKRLLPVIIKPIPPPDKPAPAPEVVPPHIFSKYGLRPHEYIALVQKQNNRCSICGNPPKKNRLHIDHCHETKKIRGLLCHGCNVAIGLIGEDAETARAIADYLDKHSGTQLPYQK